MIKHIVFFKFKPGTDEAAIADLEKSFGTLPAAIEEIKEFQVGRDVIGSERSFDFALVSSFADLAALDRYQVHPAHQAVGAKVKAMAEKVHAVDYEF